MEPASSAAYLKSRCHTLRRSCMRLRILPSWRRSRAACLSDRFGCSFPIFVADFKGPAGGDIGGFSFCWRGGWCGGVGWCGVLGRCWVDAGLVLLRSSRVCSYLVFLALLATVRGGTSFLFPTAKKKRSKENASPQSAHKCPQRAVFNHVARKKHP